MSRNETGAEGLEAEYRAGRWRFLGDLREMSRHGVIASWLTAADALAGVLDVGCGAGHFYRRIAPLGLGRYTGIDIAPTAVEEARAVVDPAHGRVEQADLAGWRPPAGERFSAIVFNEVLNYVERPETAVRRYAAFLAPGGVIAFSMYEPARPESGSHGQIAGLWAATGEAGWSVLDDVSLVSHAKRVTWRLRLVRPPGETG